VSIFGTDGVRGVANVELTPDLALRLGKAAGTWMKKHGGRSAVMGRDTRQSGPMLAMALSAGMNSAGIDVHDIGVAPTPAVSFAARMGDFHLGAVISASHNPAQDNGIKFLGHDGKKLPDEQERQIESLLEISTVGGEVGSLTSGCAWLAEYEHALADQVPERLDGMRIAVDCAHGAASGIAGRLFESLGATAVVYNSEPNGVNINAGCGATNPETICRMSVESKAVLGIAFDGDADRCVFSDENGKLINGDRTMAIWAEHWLADGDLQPPVVVGTVMSNAAFEKTLAEQHIRLERTSVGDRNVAQRMAETGARIGGEQSGHIIFSDLAPTGDGLQTALQLLRIMRRTGIAASKLPPMFENWPQLLVNMRVADRRSWQDAEELKVFVANVGKSLGDTGRVVVRPSGTQPMIRVMVEASDAQARDNAADTIVGRIESELGGSVQSRVDLTHALGD
jgi:phosphoglucosamine mutase